jgi:hypothetical protein
VQQQPKPFKARHPKKAYKGTKGKGKVSEAEPEPETTIPVSSSFWEGFQNAEQGI